MTKDEFQRQYHEYITQDDGEAAKEAVKVNEQLDVGRVVPTHFPGIGWCLMLEESAKALDTL